jgi:aerobic carbon-monoxide dehydrogenase medium subunit
MIPAAFDYERAESVEHALELVGSGRDAKLLAGGHSLLPLMRLRLARPELLVDIGRLPDLSYVREEGDRIAIGALTRYHDLERDELLREKCAIIAETSATVGDPQVRHRGTIGGSVAHGDPASDIPTVLVALEAEVAVRGPDGERTVAAGDMFTGFLETALAPNELVTEIRVPTVGDSAYVKFNRRAQDWATVGVAVARANGSVNVALTNMAATPVRASAVEEALAGGADPAAAAERAAEGTSPPSDPNGSAEYRQHLAKVLVRRALEDVAGR